MSGGSLDFVITSTCPIGTMLRRVRKIQTFSRAVVKATPRVLARLYLRKLKANWVRADTHYAELSEYWLHVKKARALDKRVWMATRTLFESLVVKELGKGDWAVMPEPEKDHPIGDGRTLQEIARDVEFGDLRRNLPPRPLWRDTAKQLKAVAPKAIETEVRRLAKRYFG